MTAGPPPGGRPDLRFALADHPPRCGRCGGEALLSATMTDERPGRHGVVRLARNVVLCARCDQDDPSAGALITFFTVHGEVTLDTAPEFTALAGAWAASVRAPGIDPAALEADIEAWHRGELDADQPPPPGPYAPDDGRLEWQDEASDWP